MKVTAGLTIDFGNSESRLKVITNNKEQLLIFGNRYAKLPKGYQIPSAYTNDKSSVFAIDGEYYANGDLAEREFNRTLKRPYALSPKYTQETTKYTLHLAICRALMYLGEIYNTDPSNLDVTFNISVIVPPLEHSTNIEDMEKLIREVSMVNMVVPQYIKTIVRIGDVRVFPEGVSAFFGAFFKEQGNSLVEEPNNIDFESGYVLVMDIGAGTTDLALIQDSTLVENSMDTFKLGGNTVQSQVVRSIKANYGGHTPTQRESIDIITTGYMPLGVDKINVIPLIDEAKQTYANSMIERLATYFESLGIDMGSLKGLLVIGGGSLPIESEDGTVLSPAMSELILAFMRNLNSRTKLMYIGDKNPRLLNIEGLTYMHKYA